LKILAICFFPAFVPPTNGGQSRLFHFYKALSRWHQITLLTSSHFGVQEEVIQHGLNFVERRIPKDNHFLQRWAALEKYSSGGDLSAPTIAACGSLPTLLHKAFLDEYENADIIFHDFPFAVDLDLLVGTDQKPRVYNAHNCETLLYQKLHPGINSRPIHDLVRVAEQRMLENADLVLYCNDSDLERFHSLAPESSFEAQYTPNGMTPIKVLKNSSDLGIRAFRAVFMGSGHPPNADAADFIVRTLSPSFPETVFDIIGSCLPEGNYPSNVIRHGVVDDATKMRILSQSDIALNPMETGSGSNVKVLDYFAYGIPVLSTYFGMRGILAQAGTHYLEASLNNFERALREATIGKATLIAVGEAGMVLALNKYTWEVIAAQVAERAEALVNSKRQNGKRRFVLALNDYDSFAGIGGGGTRTRGLYEAVRDWCPVVFVSFADDASIGTRKAKPGITVINVPKTQAHIDELERINSQFHISVNDIIASRHCKFNPWLQAVYKVLRQSARCIVIEHCYLVDLPLIGGDRFVYSSQNNETELKKRLLEWHPLKKELVAEVERIERLAVEHSAATIAVSHEHAASLVIGKRTAGQVIVVRNGAAAPESSAKVMRLQQTLQDKIGKRAVVFLGSSHMPNVEAAQFIVDRLAPQLMDIRFHLLGSVCSAIQHAPENVHLWGVLDDITKSALMQTCALALNPMNSGSGSNVKIADYLGNGLFVITTEFGRRGYPESIHEHLAVVPMDKFAEEIQKALDNLEVITDEARTRRKDLFQRELEIRSISQRFVETLKSLERPRKRVLYVAYRYASPALGGAEVNIEKFVSALGNSGVFDVDVVAPEVSGIHNHMRFSERYTFDSEVGTPVNIPNVRFARFPNFAPGQQQIDGQLRKAWSVQPIFEQVVDIELQKHYQASGLTWGWAHPEGEGASAERWAFAECGLFLHKAAQIDLHGYANDGVVTTVYSDGSIVAGPFSFEGNFLLSFQAKAGELRLATSATQTSADPRPLAIKVLQLRFNGVLLELSAPTLSQRYLPLLPAAQRIRLLDQAAAASRLSQGVRLTEIRGPWSDSLERFIADHVKDYDLVVTHNNVFRPAVIAIEESKKHGVPSILIPHAHLDDDFYHFPDLLESARNASVVLAVPKAACDFLSEKGCNVQYLSAGCDVGERFTAADQEAFREAHASPRPFILVLGRKAGAKGYRHVIDAVEELNRDGIDLQTLLIGPDDDGMPVNAPNAVYLGRQPRNVVRGALLSCMALCNMSSSESFGIVLLEAWLAGKPVVANVNCAAFHDMAVHGGNALLTTAEELPKTIKMLVSNPDLQASLGKNGGYATNGFDWKVVSNEFLNICISMISEKV
jgi:glycosyltransferase involved in cell wall biosynthesis